MYKVLIKMFVTRDSPILSFTSHREGGLQFIFLSSDENLLPDLVLNEGIELIT